MGRAPGEPMSSHHHDIKVYGEIKLFAGTGSPELARKISEYLGSPLCEHEVIEFPNENLFIKLNHSVRGQDVYVIQQTASPVHQRRIAVMFLNPERNFVLVIVFFDNIVVELGDWTCHVKMVINQVIHIDVDSLTTEQFQQILGIVTS